LAATARFFAFLHFFFFGVDGPVPVGGVGPDEAHVVSVGATALLRGFGEVGEKSAALLFVSSLASSAVGQPGAIDLRSAMPEDRAAAGVPGLALDP
jgi:hypothetical protein